MRIKSILKPLLTAILISSSWSAFAGPQEVACPSIETVKANWERLDTVQVVMYDMYLIYSADETVYDAASDRSWSIITRSFSAKKLGFNDTFVNARENVKNVSVQVNKISELRNGEYGCEYRERKQDERILLISRQKGQGGDVNKASMSRRLA